MNKVLLSTGIALCVGLAGFKLIQVVQSHMPIAKPGQCIMVEVAGVKAKFRVLNNDNIKGDSMIQNSSGQIFGPISYQELHDYNAKKVSCK